MHHEDLPLLMYLGNPPPHRDAFDAVRMEELQAAFGPNALSLGLQRALATRSVTLIGPVEAPEAVRLLPKGLEMLSALKPARRPLRWAPTPALDLA